MRACATNTRLFRMLVNEWHFSPGPTPQSCQVDFIVNYQFHNALYAQVPVCACVVVHYI